MTVSNRYDNLLPELKERLHVVTEESDDNLRRLLLSSYIAVKKMCGDFSIEHHYQGKELVFERVRYAYNDMLEFFIPNFLVEINNLSLDLSVYNGGDYD